LLTKRIALGVVVLAVLVLVGYAVYVFYFVPVFNPGGAIRPPETPEQKLRVLNDLSKDGQFSATNADEKEEILNSLSASTTGGTVSGSEEIPPVVDPESPEGLQKIKLLESLQK
jgi:hypothetical protein